MKGDIILSVVSEEFYNQSLFNMIGDVKGKKICYITLNKTASSLQKAMKSKKLPLKDIFFIDAVSKSLKQKELENAVYISSPAAVNELKVAIIAALNSKICDVLVFDALSALSIYGFKDSVLEDFLKSIIIATRAQADKGIFICLERDLSTNLVQSVLKYVDTIHRHDDLYRKLRKQRVMVAYGILFTLILLGTATYFSFNFEKANSATGLVISEHEGLQFVSWLVYLALGALSLLLFVRGAALRPLSGKYLLKIKPANSNLEEITDELTKKIQRWGSHPLKL